MYHKSINLNISYQCTTRQFNTRQGSRVTALFPNCHHECVSGAGICHTQGHTPLCNMSATGTAITLDEWQIPGNSHSCHAHRHVLCPGGIVLRHHRKRPALTCMRKTKAWLRFTWEKIRIEWNVIRIFNTAIYNNKLWFMYIKMISTSSGIYWYN